MEENNMINLAAKAAVFANQDAANIAKEYLPNVNANRIINEVVLVLTNQKTVEQVKSELFGDVVIAGSIYAQEFTSSFAQNVMIELVGDSTDEKLKNLTKREFTDKLVEYTKSLTVAINKYHKGEITDEELFDLLLNESIKEIVVDVAKAMDIDLEEFKRLFDALLATSTATLAYNATVQVYEELMAALNDENLAYERRMRIKAECQQSIEMIVAYRTVLEENITKYFNEHLDTLNDAFDAMDKALLENDVDGYIKSNNQIQDLLGSKIQYRNFEEFVDLMESDEAFDF